MSQLALLHALGAACTLRQSWNAKRCALDASEEAVERLMARSKVLLRHQERAMLLALVWERIGISVRHKGIAQDEQLLRSTRHTVLDPIAQVWTLQESERQRRLGTP